MRGGPGVEHGAFELHVSPCHTNSALMSRMFYPTPITMQFPLANRVKAVSKRSKARVEVQGQFWLFCRVWST